jgi:pyruvate dehydrogenase E2 component (dihydrolipoamide acetyltransferase)
MKDVEEAGAPSQSRVAQGAADSSSNMVALSQMRKTIARRLVEVWNDTPHFYLTADIDMAKAMAQRAEINAQLKAAGSEVKISVNDLIVKASAVALRNYPKMNVAFRGDSIEQYGDVHVGVAVAIPDGLITPVIRDADQKTLSQVATEIRELATRAKDKRLKPHEYTGSTFSISNLGMYQIDEFSAIINPPEAAILACGSVRQTPVVEDGEIVVGTRMKITLSCDHRAVDGAVGAEFLMELRRLLENPILLLV